MAKRNYSNIAVETTLVSGITDSSSSLTVADPSGWPAAPFILIIDQGETKEELIPVGAKSGAVFSSLTRGFGGTSGVAHTAGATIKHVAVAEDLALIWAHVHTGVSGDDTAQVSHVSLGSVGSNDHHNQQHAIDGSDHTGTLDHDEIANQTVDDHHAQDHQARHIPGGADPLPTGTPGSSAPGDSAAEGSATSFARSDHVHGRESGFKGWQLTKSADQLIQGEVTADITWDVEDIDSDSFHSGADPQITVPVGSAGLYDIRAVLGVNRNAGTGLSDYARLVLVQNAVEIFFLWLHVSDNDPQLHSATLSFYVQLAEGDTLKWQCHASPVGEYDITGVHNGSIWDASWGTAIPGSVFSGRRIGP